MIAAREWCDAAAMALTDAPRWNSVALVFRDAAWLYSESEVHEVQLRWKARQSMAGPTDGQLLHFGFLAALPAPILYAVTFLVGVGIDQLYPWSFDAESEGLRWAGWLLVVIGLVLAPSSAVMFGLRRTTLNPVGQPAHLVTTGAFRWTRNPMYLGVSVIYVGLALVLDVVWALLLIPGPLLVMNVVTIPGEEAALRNQFGQAYVDYCQRVRRWL
jgi:protein-S-isoprenylcysteine O-methyltransferase Ste14